MELDETMLNEITAQTGFKIIRKYAIELSKSNKAEDCFLFAQKLYTHSDYRVQELGVFLLGYIAGTIPPALCFLKETVCTHPSWEVQEICAMAFDSYCASIGYENALETIVEWLSSSNPNTRRAVTEGLRIWTGRPYFKEHPEKALAFLSPLRSDPSQYVRKSVGNALKDISKKFPDLIQKELQTWDVSSKETMQVYKLAGKFLK